MFTILRGNICPRSVDGSPCVTASLAVSPSKNVTLIRSSKPSHSIMVFMETAWLPTDDHSHHNAQPSQRFALPPCLRCPRGRSLSRKLELRERIWQMKKTSLNKWAKENVFSSAVKISQRIKTSRVAWIPAWWGCECLWRCCVHWSHTSTLTALSKAVVCWRSAAFESQGFVFYSLWLWIQLNVKHFNEKIIWNYWHFYLLTKWQIIKKATFCLNTQPVCIPLPSVL